MSRLSKEGLEEEAPTSPLNRTLKVTVPLKSLSENRPVSTEKDKRPLPLYDNQPSKRLRGELTDHEVSPGSVGFLPSSVEHGQSSSSVTSQSHKGHDYQRRQNQSSSDHGRPPLPVGYNQLSFATVTQPSMQTHQTSHTQKLLGQMFKNLQQMQCDTGNVCSKDALSAKLERIASDKGFVISDNEGSGNCMFYALSEQLHLVKGITISHEKLRQVIVQYLRKNPKLPDGTDLFNFINGYRSWADYLTDMERDGTWGDHVILYAVANCFEMYIHVISSQSDHHDLTIRPDCHVISTNPLVLGHVHDVHYLSLKPKQEDESVQTGHYADKVVLNKEATTEGSSDHGRAPLSVGYNQLSFTAVTQPSTQTHQTSHTQIAFKEGEPSGLELDELAGKIGAKWKTLGIHLGIGQDVLEGIDDNAKDKPYQMLLRWRNTTTSATPYGHLYHALCHDRVGLNNLAKEFCCPSGYGWPPLTMEYNRTSYPATTQTFGEKAAYQGMHTQIDVRVILSATMKFEAEHEECVRVLPYLNNGDVEIHLYVYRDRSGIPTKLETAAKAFFEPKDWKLMWADLYNDAFNFLQVTSIKYPSGEPKRLEASQVDEIEEIIDKHLHVFSNHRNVTAVQPSFKVTKSVQTEEACIVVYVLGKGQIPMGESAIPCAIGPYPVDIVNGFCVRTKDPYMPTEAHKQKEFLRLGASIGVNGKQSSGTLGAIVEDKNSGTLYALSCDHVMNNADESEIIHPGLDVYLNCLRFNLNGYKNWIDRITGFALELPQISDDSLEETELQKIFVELKKVKEMRIDPKGCSNSVKEQITIFERNLEEAFGKPPRVIASYSAGVRCNVGSKMNKGREHFIDAAISELNKDEVNNVKTEKFLHIIDTTHYPSGECISATINATMDVEELFKSGSATGFTESSLILGISQRLPTFLTDFRPNGVSAWIDVDCINCKKRGTAQSQGQELSGLCEQCRPYRWLKRCLCIQQHGRKPFSDKGDSGAVIFEKLRKENGNEYQLPSPGFGIIFAELPSQHGNFAIASPLEIALEELSQKVSESRPDNEPCQLRLASSFR